MKSSELLRILLRDGWYEERRAKGSHMVLKHPRKSGIVIFPTHGSAEVGKGLAAKILKDAGIK
ncbi:putative RNA binding protein YcfA (HicA-like mRNA interferase family) [Arcticibacter tournemirensis]|uniref:Addiction module toxin, HicA family n=1 Tax=Arcticibacter tournemirensis TaxID=699437 RepID=A0A5M9GQ76_9SPHI|nr:type II toxin-antitoxin system HicA family toxin [Arcticibacter tournemirensis]KAA8474924.1 addiction module toxin, HicA family [Arcticibacter tournemirensis]TQM48540.1 putative RNA binding protein YcfA (HicA-like mRNA interferase family) [Arcticibacter tournemirensis]